MFKFIGNLLLLLIVLKNMNKWIQSKFLHKFYAQYFTVLAILLSFENSLSFILNEIPFYHLIRIVFMFAISFPNSRIPFLLLSLYIRKYYSITNELLLQLNLYCKQLIRHFILLYQNTPAQNLTTKQFINILLDANENAEITN